MLDWLEQHLFPCFWKSHFGIECPGCGLQRAFILLLRGDIQGSIHQHAGLIPFLLTMAWALYTVKYGQRKSFIVLICLLLICAFSFAYNFFILHPHGICSY